MFGYRGPHNWLVPHPLTGEHGDGRTYGALRIPPQGGLVGDRRRAMLHVLFSGDDGWEHVSVSTPTRPPTWDELTRIKALFWDDEDGVLQFMPPRSVYVNRHPHCLHLWRRAGENPELPPLEFV